MSNLSVYVRLGADVLTEQQVFYGYKAGWGFQILITLGTFFIGFCLAGLFRAIVVLPKNLIWPGVLSVTALTTTLHNVGQGEVQSRYAKSLLLFSDIPLNAGLVSTRGKSLAIHFSPLQAPCPSAGTGSLTSSSLL